MPVVAVEPRQEMSLAFVGVGIFLSVGPLFADGLDKALGLAVGLWPIWPCVEVAHIVGEAGALKGLGSVATAVVGHEALGRHSELGVKGQGGLEEAQGTEVALARQDRRKGEAGVIVDDDMEVFPTGTSDVIAGVSSHAVADGLNPPKLLNIKM